MPERYRALLLTGAYTGLRSGELAGLRVARVNMLSRRIDVAEILVEVNGTMSFGPPKTAKSRNGVSFPPFLEEDLTAHLAHFPDVDSARGLVFTSEDGTPLRRSNFRRRVWLPAQGGRRSGVDDLSRVAARDRELADRLGRESARGCGASRHSRVTTTLSVYGRLFEGVDARLDELLEATRARAIANEPRSIRGLASA